MFAVAFVRVSETLNPFCVVNADDSRAVIFFRASDDIAATVAAFDSRAVVDRVVEYRNFSDMRAEHSALVSAASLF